MPRPSPKIDAEDGDVPVGRVDADPGQRTNAPIRMIAPRIGKILYLPVRRDQPAGADRRGEEADDDRQHGQAGLGRRHPHHALQVERQEDDRAEHGDAGEEAEGDCRCGKPRCGRGAAE